MSVDADLKSNPPVIPFTFVIPAYNEERRLPAAIGDIKAFFGSLPFEILIIVEKSKDRTLQLARLAAGEDSRFRIIDNQVHKGKGYAVKTGMLMAKGDFVFFMDADLSTPLAEVWKFLAHFSAFQEAHVLIGSRAHAQSQIIRKQSWIRRNLGRSFNKFVQIFGIRGIEDTQCGFKAFRALACREIFSRQKLNSFAFDVEILLIAESLGYKIDTLPVRWVNSPDSKVRILIDPFKMFIDLIQTRRLVRKTMREKPLLP